MVIIDEGEHPIIVLLGKRIELVVVALAALDGQAEDALADGVHPVEHRIHPELFRVDRAFLVEHRIAEETGGDPLVLGGVGKLVSGELLDDELVIRQVAIEGIDDVVAVSPHVARHVFLIAIRVRIPRRIQPMPAPTLSVVRRVQQTLDLLLVRARIPVSQKRIHFRDGRRKADQVQAQPPEQRDLVSFGRWFELFLLQPGENERINRIAHPAFAFHLRRVWPHRGFERPMFPGIFCNPGFAFGSRGSFAFVGWCRPREERGKDCYKCGYQHVHQIACRAEAA